MMRLAGPLALALLLPTAAAGAAHDDFVPRLLQAIDAYMRAHDACLRRVMAAMPVEGRGPDAMARAAIATCRSSDPQVRATTKRVFGFPSVDNFMAGKEDEIVAFSIRLAKARIAGRPLGRF